MRTAEIIRDEHGNVIRYKRKRTYAEIVQDAEEYFAKLAEQLKAEPDFEFDFEEFKKNYIWLQSDTNCDTSGVRVTENADGSVEIGYVDFEVPHYGGMDHEYMSRLDKENADKLREALSKTYQGTLKEMFYQAFAYGDGEVLDHSAYDYFCDDNEIKKHDFCWTS